MRRKAHLLLAVLLAAAAAGVALKRAEGSPAAFPVIYPQISARSAVLLDGSGQHLLFTKRLCLRVPPASTTKVMTALVVLERLPLGTQVLVSPHAASMPNSKAGLKRGVRYSAADLLVAMLVSSANDAASALAEAAAGSETEFAKLMNAKAKALGMNDTYFVNATGLPDKKSRQFSTAYDLALLMCAASRDARIDTILGITRTAIRGSDGRMIEIVAHNKLLFTKPGRVKGKTGYTIASKHTFIGMNYEAKKTYVFSMLSSKDPWPDIDRLSTLGRTLTERK